MLKIKLITNGPLRIKGPFVYIDEQKVSRDIKGDPLTLCRCGRTKIAPFCDESHKFFSFNTQDQLKREYVVSNEQPNLDGGTTVVTGIENGPLHISGPTFLVDESHVSWEGNNVKLCRCGCSQIKPFCDGAHKRIF